MTLTADEKTQVEAQIGECKTALDNLAATVAQGGATVLVISQALRAAQLAVTLAVLATGDAETP